MFYTSLTRKHYVNSGIRKHIYGGLFFKAWGAYPVYRGLNDYEKSLKHHIEILNSKRSLCFFPEGKVTKTGELSEAKGGIAFLSHHTQTPIVPVRISGVFRMGFFDILHGKRNVSVEFGKPVYMNEFKNYNNAHEEQKKVANYIMSEITKLNNN